MFRNFITTATIVLLSASAAWAIDYEGKVTAFDAATHKVTVHVDDNDQTFEIAKDCKIYKRKGAGKREHYEEDPKGLKDVVKGAKVKIATDFVDGNEVVTMLKIASLPRQGD